MKSLTSIVTLCLTIFLVSCKEEKKAPEAPAIEVGSTTFYLIRHAEKDRSNPDNVDPELNQQGLGRAMHWAEILENVSLDAIYTTDFNRTSMTAAPTAVKKEITPQYYDPELIDIKQFKSDNLNKNVLVVGHSNTTPALVNKLIDDDKYYEISDSENGSLFIVKIVNGIATDTRLEINCSCPTRE